VVDINRTSQTVLLENRGIGCPPRGKVAED
jgi:hypothetical protein